ncbi:MAG: Grx4 family monothiol glutaredoxin [Proteobacteria bacterium]|nr:Grx4 family monothiol glutaredoxin [Pseudomonadota bacterium]
MTEETKQRVAAAIASHKVVLFMKGVPDFPQCGFSARAAGCLEQLGVPFAAFDVLPDRELREGLKEHSRWPTLPQLYIAGELIGGSDIVTELFQSGELKLKLEQAGAL